MATDSPSPTRVAARFASEMARRASQLRPGPIRSSAEFKLLKPGDSLTREGKPITVIEYDAFDASLVYVEQGKTTRKRMDARYAWSDSPGETPEIQISYVGPGTAPEKTRRPPARAPSRSFYD